MATDPLTFGVELEQQEGFEFRVRFDWPEVPELLLDEPVTQSIRQGIPVNVSVVDAEGKVLDHAVA